MKPDTAWPMAASVGLLLTCGCACAAAQGRGLLASPPQPRPVHLAILADRTGGERPGVFPRVLDEVELLQPDFVVCVGDLIAGYSEDERVVTHQQAQLDRVLQRLSMPFHRLPGNHDITNPSMAAWWTRRYGPRYYHFMFDNVLCLMLNTEEGQIPGGLDAQAAYMCAVLASNRAARCTLVFMHKPVWLAHDVPAWWQTIAAALRKRPHAVFAGHVHTYQKYERNGAPYYTLATSGGASDLAGIYAGTFDHFTWVTVGSGMPVVANVRVDGVLPDDIITEESAALAARMRTAGIQLPPLLLDTDTFRACVLTLTISNCLTMPIAFTAPVKVRGAMRVQPDAIDETLAPGAQRAIPLAVRNLARTLREPVGVITLPWRLRIAAPGRRAMHTQGTLTAGITRQQTCPRTTRAITVDGALDDWAGAAFITGMPAQTAGTAAPSCCYRFATAHDDKFVYLVVDVTDDHRVAKPGVDPWNQDGVEVRVVNDPWRIRKPTEKQAQELLLAFSPGRSTNDMVWFEREKMPAGIVALCLATPTGYVTEMAIPMALSKHVRRPWRAFRLNITVNDTDAAAGPVAKWWWRPDWYSREDYRGSGTFRLTE
ncbi:MAG: metallophosphoesterase [bacterium]|nr:metallophosphoesterase [bacterium]